MMNIPFPIIKITLHMAHNVETVFIFTGVKTPAGDYIMIQVACPVGEGEKWIYSTFKTLNYEKVLEEFTVCAPV
jgi:hypothetical protein